MKRNRLLEANIWYRFSAFWLRSKCSICSYQLNIWYEGHRPSSILNWFLDGDRVSAACCGSIMCWPCIAVPQGTAHFPTKFSLMNTMAIKENLTRVIVNHMCFHYVLKKTKAGMVKLIGSYFDNYISIISTVFTEIATYSMLFSSNKFL